MAAPKWLPRSFLRAKMKVKVAQKSSTEPFESSENDLKIKNVNVHKNYRKIEENYWFLKLRRPIGSSDLHRKGSWHQILRLWRSLGHREAIRRASRRSPRAPKSDQESLKEGFQELPNCDPWSLSSDYELSRSRWQPPKSSQGAS